jgi:tRNA G18 (ribose-2'-O)-methylase SpoU
LRVCADKKHAADNDLDKPEILDCKWGKTWPAFVEQCLKHRAILEKVSKAEIDENAAEDEAKECIREKGKEHRRKKVQHYESVYHGRDMSRRQNPPQKKLYRVFVAVEDVRSAHNVGSIFRTADAAGVEGLYLIGATPAPTDRFGRAQPDIAKTALGAEKTLPWRYFETTSAFLSAVRKDGFEIVAVEQDKRAVDYKALTVARASACDLVLVFGNEVTGVSEALLAAADEIVQIPMLGKKESLNVSVAAGIVLYALLDG